MSRLRESGLLTLLVPAGLGDGGGADRPTAYAVVREIAAADGAIGQLLSCHPALPDVVIDGDTDPFGQRLAAGGSVEFDAVPIAADDVVGSLAAEEDVLSPLTALVSPVGRLLSAQFRTPAVA
ncbi:hypothetical protein GCM10010255_75890 [Streptomyces coeruleofuscus]|uniref:Acyl-CoA dehydrogenase n=1 Tax=Streptomyces coeruleofuscus TaxID=66879 RepID=A0ABN3J8G4_9ACTN